VTAAALALGLAQAAPAVAASHLRYFGFTGGCDTERVVQEIAPFSNVCLVDIQDPRLLDPAWVTKMLVRDMRLVVAAHTTFFELVEPPGGGVPGFDLRDDYAQRWQQAIAGKKLALEALASFVYVADEPNWNGISRDELATAVQEVKRSLPWTRTMTSFNHVLDSGWFEGREAPTDAVAYHQYGVRDPRVDPLFQANVALIKSYAPGRDFLYVLDAWWSAGHRAKGLEPGDMAEVAANYYLMAAEDPDAVGMVAFHWLTFTDGTGARELPQEVRRRYWTIGAEITGKCLGPDGVEARSALFFDGCSYFATLRYEGLEDGSFAAAMPRERSFGTWVLGEGDVVGALKIEDGAELRVYPSVYSEAAATIRIYDATDGQLVWASEVRGGAGGGPVRIPRLSSARVAVHRSGS